jgi:hypothetical protein
MAKECRNMSALPLSAEAKQYITDYQQRVFGKSPAAKTAPAAVPGGTRSPLAGGMGPRPGMTDIMGRPLSAEALAGLQQAYPGSEIKTATGGSAPWAPAALNNAPVPYPALNAGYGGGGGGGSGGGGMKTWSATFVPRADQQGVNTGFFPGDHAKDALEKQAWLDEQRRKNQPRPQPPVVISEKSGYQPLMGRGTSAIEYGPSGGGGGGGMGGGGMVGGGADGGMAAANQANEARYQDILNGYQQRYERSLAGLEGAGKQEAADINKLYDEQLSSINNDLVSRGMRNSSLAGNARTGNDRERIADIARLNERLRQEKLAVDAGLSKDTLDVMERKTDLGPDLALLAQLQKAASMGGGMGGVMAGGMPGGGGVDYAPAASLGFQNPLMWAAQAMMGGQGSVPMIPTGRSGSGFESSKERYERQHGRPWDTRISDNLLGLV